MLAVVAVLAVAFAIVLAAARIIVGWISAPAGVRFGRAIDAVSSFVLKLTVVAVALAIVAFAVTVFTSG